MKNSILPAAIISLVEQEAKGLEFGAIRLEIFFRDGKPRWEYSKSVSIMDETIHKNIGTNCIERGERMQ